MIGVIGISVTICGCLVLRTDWQTISYDPCTEYSPFHHPEILKNITAVHDVQPTSNQIQEFTPTFNMQAYSEMKLSFDNGETQYLQIPF